jgi:hypothetical protein
MEMIDTQARLAVMENEVKNICEELKELRVEQKDHHNLMMAKLSKMDERIAIIERWRWMLLGGALVTGYFFAHVQLGKFFA